MISDKRPVQDLLSLLEARGVHHVVICPGSRNAPFSISLHQHPVLKSYNIPDERTAGFFALGMAQQMHLPVVLICTSGTAALNFAPAIAEAYYQRVPLLVITADRPVEWIDQGEGQSIRQRDVYSNYVKASYEVSDTGHPDQDWHNVRVMDEAIALTTSGVLGPVHLNFPLREPLYGVIENPKRAVKTVERVATPAGINQTAVEALKAQLTASSKVMILAGQALPNEALRQALRRWSQLPQVAILTEAHSNMADERFITTIDRMIMRMTDDERKSILPEILITYGHNIISRKIKEFLRQSQCEHWHIDISGEGLDTLKHLNKIVAMEPATFFEVALPQPHANAEFAQHLSTLNATRKTKAKAFLKTAPWSDLKAFDVIYPRIPAGHDLQMGNSSVVRYILLEEAREDLRHFGNRGVAGIDGCTSTAIGATWMTGRATTLISGDIGFFYDSNAFWHKYVPQALKIIVINNGGGGIFRIIEGPKTSPAIDDYFETTHDRTAAPLAAMYGLPYRASQDEASLQAGLDWLYAEQGCSILEVFTPRLENDQVLKKYFEFISQ